MFTVHIGPLYEWEKFGSRGDRVVGIWVVKLARKRPEKSFFSSSDVKTAVF